MDVPELERYTHTQKSMQRTPYPKMICKKKKKSRVSSTTSYSINNLCCVLAAVQNNVQQFRLALPLTKADYSQKGIACSIAGQILYVLHSKGLP